MIPGEIFVEPGEIELNAGRPVLKIDVANTGDRPIQVGSHYHFYEVNEALKFDRESTRGYRLEYRSRHRHPLRARSGKNGRVGTGRRRSDHLRF